MGLWPNVRWKFSSTLKWSPAFEEDSHAAVGADYGVSPDGVSPLFMYKSAAVHVAFMPYFRALKQPKPSKSCCHMLFKLLKQHVAAYFRWSGRASWRGTPSSGKYVRSAERPSQRNAGGSQRSDLLRTTSPRPRPRARSPKKCRTLALV